MKYTVRSLNPEEYPLLADFLLESIYIPQEDVRPPVSYLETPQMQVYIRDFGREKDDFALGAEADEKIVGVIWARIMEDYGHIDDATPSLAMSVLLGYRGAGVGTALLETMLTLLSRQGYAKTSLSVQKANTAALRLYRKAGFEPAVDLEDEYIMVHRLSLSDSVSGP